MSVIGSKISWMRQTRSVSSMARETGISSRTIFAIERGNYTPSSDQLRLLNNLYRNESYYRLKLAGVPRIQAQSVAGGNLTRVSELEKTSFFITNEFTKGALLKQYGAEWVNDIRTRTQEKAYGEMFGRIVSGLSESYKSIEEIWKEKRS